MPWILRPSRVFHKYLRTIFEDVDQKSYELGGLAIGLEIVGQIKFLEELAVVSDVGRSEAVSALHTLLTDLGMADEAYAMYDRLSRWRQLRFEPEPVTIADAEPSDDPPRRGRTVGSSSAPDAPVGWPFRGDRPHSSPEVRRDPETGAWPSRGAWE